MKKIFVLQIMAMIAVWYCGCQFLEDVVPDDPCGQVRQIGVPMCLDTSTCILTSYYGLDNGQAMFIFSSPEWLDTVKMCSKEHVKAYYEVKFLGYGLEDLPNLNITGKVVVGAMPYEVTLKWTGAKFEATDNEVGLNGWAPFVSAGWGTVWSQIIIKFDTSGDEATDVKRLEKVMTFIGVAFEYHLPKKP